MPHLAPSRDSVNPAEGLLIPAHNAVQKSGTTSIYAVVGLHIAAMVWHRLVKRDSVLALMPPGIR